LHIADGSELLRAKYEYGFDQPTKLMMQIDFRRKRLALGVKQTEDEMKKLEESRWKTQGAHDEAAYWHNVVSGYR
jgi:hypothetical protein